MVRHQRQGIVPVDTTQDHVQTEVPEVPYLGSDSPVEALVVADSSSTEVHLLRFETSGMQTKWYTKRPMPDFEVKLVRPDGRLYTDTAGWKLTLRLVTGDGIYDEEGKLLRGPKGMDDTALAFPLNAGRAVISGLRFQAVSSKNGKTFSLEFSIPSDEVATSKSAPIIVLSERLKNERKAAVITDLRPSDDIARVPSLGKAYCQRLNQLGFRTVADLATIPVSPADRQVRLQLLNRLRKDRGALTEAKLMNLVRDAHKVVQAEAVRQIDEEELDGLDEPNDDHGDDLVDHARATEAAAANTAVAVFEPSPPVAPNCEHESEAELTARKLNCPLWGQGLLQDIEPNPEEDKVMIDDMLNFDCMDVPYGM